VVDRIVLLRKELADAGLDNGPATIRFHLQRAGGPVPSESTIWRVLRDRGFVTAQPRKAPKRAYHRFVAERANECWQIDATKWGLVDGSSVEIINVIDDCTRVLIASVAVKTCTTANSWDALAQGAQRWGWPERVLSDNGKAFRGNDGRGGVVPALSALGIANAHSRPYHPQTCGKVERFHQTLKRHLQLELVATLTDLQAQLDRFAEIYNHHRPHRGIGRRFPADVWETTPRSGPADHPIGTPTRVSFGTIRTDGRVKIAQHTRVGVGMAHAGKPATTVITGTNAHIFINGRLIRHLVINPNNADQPRLDNPNHTRRKDRE
jgi:transposase InsO family protein